MKPIWKILPVFFVEWWAKKHLERLRYDQGINCVRPFHNVVILVDK